MMRSLAFRVSLLALASCMDAIEPDVGEVIAGACKNEDTNPETKVSFRDELLPMLHRGCGCHSPISPASGSAIDMTGFSVGDYYAIRRGGQVSGAKIVVPGEPCNSFLYLKLSESPPSGARMPIFGPYWPREDMAVMHDWIAEGARED